MSGILEISSGIIERIEKTAGNLKDRSVYIDIKDRLLFISLFTGLLKCGSKIVMMPVEIMPEDYYFDGGIFITDNKEDTRAFVTDKNYNLVSEPVNQINKIDVIDKYDLYFFTSGSSGKPKLVGKSYENFITEVKELKRIFTSEKGMKIFVTPPLYHIYGFLFGMLLPASSGAVLYTDFVFTPESIAEFVNTNKIDFFASTPSYYDYFRKLDLSSCFVNTGFMASSSGPLSLETSGYFYNHGCLITEVYGSTETGGIATRVAHRNMRWKFFSYVDTVNNIPEDMDDGITSLKIRSDAISVDYDQECGYDTGDIYILYEDGFELAGRNSRFVKIAGKRLDLEFVVNKFALVFEEIYSLKPDNTDIAVIEDSGRVYLGFEKRVSDEINCHYLKEELKKHLPGYAVPRVIKECIIPRNSMGKIDRKKMEEILTK